SSATIRRAWSRTRATRSASSRDGSTTTSSVLKSSSSIAARRPAPGAARSNHSRVSIKQRRQIDMSKIGVKFLTVAVALLFSASLAAAADKLSAGETRFIKDAAGGGLFEVEMGKLAQEKAASQQVKDFAKKMDQDHSKANSELKQLASTKNVQIADKLEGKHKSTYDRLAKLSGERFDREYMKTMIDDHKTDVDHFKKE